MKRPVSSQDPRRIPEQLRRKYDVRGPRYTSYPPANHFGPVDEQELLRRWRARNELADDPGLSLYLHIPFCRRRCLFCGCHTFVAKNAGQAGRYVSALITEMKLVAGIIDPARPLRQIALGGAVVCLLASVLWSWDNVTNSALAWFVVLVMLLLSIETAVLLFLQMPDQLAAWRERLKLMIFVIGGHIVVLSLLALPLMGRG